MKRIHFLLFAFASAIAIAVGYTDSHAIQKDSIQVYDQEFIAVASQDADFSAECPLEVVVDAPDLGSPASNYIMVRENLAGVIKICIRPPPEKVQKSVFNIEIS